MVLDIYASEWLFRFLWICLLVFTNKPYNLPYNQDSYCNMDTLFSVWFCAPIIIINDYHTVIWHTMVWLKYT